MIGTSYERNLAIQELSVWQKETNIMLQFCSSPMSVLSIATTLQAKKACTAALNAATAMNNPDVLEADMDIAFTTAAAAVMAIQAAATMNDANTQNIEYMEHVNST
jgi:hypothetical protein